MEVIVHQAKTHLSRLLQRVAGGGEITIAEDWVVLARHGYLPVEPGSARQAQPERPRITRRPQAGNLSFRGKFVGNGYQSSFREAPITGTCGQLCSEAVEC